MDGHQLDRITQHLMKLIPKSMLSEFETIWLVKLTTKLLKKKFISDPQFEFWILLILKEKLLVENTEVQSKRSLHYSRVILRPVFNSYEETMDKRTRPNNSVGR